MNGKHLLPVNGDRADQLAFFQQRDYQQRASAGEVSKFDDGFIAVEVRFLSPDILDVRDLFGSRDMGQAAVRVRMNHMRRDA